MISNQRLFVSLVVQFVSNIHSCFYMLCRIVGTIFSLINVVLKHVNLNSINLFLANIINLNPRPPNKQSVGTKVSNSRHKHTRLFTGTWVYKRAVQAHVKSSPAPGQPHSSMSQRHRSTDSLQLCPVRAETRKSVSRRRTMTPLGAHTRTEC